MATEQARPTLKSIADELKLSTFAVSRALGGKSGVSDETRQLVIETANRLGYETRAGRVSAIADTIQVVFNDTVTANAEIWLGVRNGIEMQAIRAGYNVNIVLSSDPAEVSRLKDASIGFIMVGIASRAVLEAARTTGLPVVLCGHSVPPLMGIDQVTSTDEEAGVQVAEYLESLGHTDIVYVHGKVNAGRQRRLEGLRAGISPSTLVSEITFTEDYAIGEFVPEMLRLIDAGACPTAIYCGSDGVAVTCLAEVLRLGLSIPEDISVVGHADYPMSTQVTPNLTTVRLPLREIGARAVEMVALRNSSNPKMHTMHQRIMLVSTFVERQSTGACGKPDWRRALKRTKALNGRQARPLVPPGTRS